MFTKVPSELFIFDKSIVLEWEKQKNSRQEYLCINLASYKALFQSFDD